VTVIAAPLVSVIIPTYRRANLVLRAVRTVLDQTASDFEVLIVDDGTAVPLGPSCSAGWGAPAL